MVILFQETTTYAFTDESTKKWFQLVQDSNKCK